MENLTNAQQQEIRNEYANEDFNLLKDELVMAITGTIHGVIHLEAKEKNFFTAFNGMGEELILTNDETEMKAFIAKSYVFAQA